MDWTKEEKLELLTDRFKRPDSKDLGFEAVECNVVPFIVIRAAWMLSESKMKRGHNVKWMDNKRKYEYWLMEILTPYLDSWGEKYIGISSPSNFRNISIWVKGVSGTWHFGIEKELDSILKYKETWV